MKNIHLKPFICLLALFFLDMSPFLNLLFNADFTMSGIIFLSLYLDFRVVLFYSLLFGIAKDALSCNALPVFTLNFTAIVLLIKGILKYFEKKSLSIFIAVFVIIGLSSFFDSVFERSLSLVFYLKFILSSFAVFGLIYYTLSGWIQE